mgnify:CR=1 FL=1
MMRAAKLQGQKGIALVLVLWVLLLLTIMTASFSLMARMDRLEANTLLSGTQARFSAEAAINLAVLALRDPQEETRMLADGRVYEQVIEGILVEVTAIDERGKLDINATDELSLANLFVGHGMQPDDAELLAAAVLDWRDQDDMERVNGAEEDAYFAAGLQVGPANRPFVMAEELLQVIGMPYELFRRIEPGITVFSRSGEPDPAFAPRGEALPAWQIYQRLGQALGQDDTYASAEAILTALAAAVQIGRAHV